MYSTRLPACVWSEIFDRIPDDLTEHEFDKNRVMACDKIFTAAWLDSKRGLIILAKFFMAR